MAKNKKTGIDMMSHVDVRMYRMGTGDCFVLKFFADETNNSFTMMIDCGTWRQTDDHKLATYIKDLKAYVGKKPIDVLVITHEHKDHVYGFEVCEDLFLNDPDFSFKEIWMGWPENDDSDDKVKEWKRDYGQHKIALKLAAQQLMNIVESPDEKTKAEGMPNGLDNLKIRQHFANTVTEFADLHLSEDLNVSDPNDPAYVGSLKGMAVVKEKIAKSAPINYYKPGDIITNLESKIGIRFYVLGPPTSIEAIRMESAPSNKPNEAYKHSHNNIQTNSEAFVAAVLNLGASHILPFDEAFLDPESQQEIKTEPNQKAIYEGENWRTIDHDWLNSAGSLALRMNSSTNNLSLALAIEFVGSGRVMLFPGDAEYGSWASWHDIVWTRKGKDEKPLATQNLLNQTVFYKVAHHLSHNGSAKLRGIEMMTHPDLAAMATLDYDRISPGWMNTMPNRDLVAALLTRTKGRLMIMNDEGLYLDQTTKKEPLKAKIKEVREQLMSSEEQKEFERSFKVDPNNLYLQYRVEGK